jgi:hypothetical protein
LRRYSQRPRRTWKDRVPELAIGAGLSVVFFGLLLGVLWAFTRRPIVTLGVLIVVWALGLVGLVVKRRRDRERERALHKGQEGQ